MRSLARGFIRFLVLWLQFCRGSWSLKPSRPAETLADFVNFQQLRKEKEKAGRDTDFDWNEVNTAKASVNWSWVSWLDPSTYVL